MARCPNPDFQRSISQPHDPEFAFQRENRECLVPALGKPAFGERQHKRYKRVSASAHLRTAVLLSAFLVLASCQSKQSSTSTDGAAVFIAAANVLDQVAENQKNTIPDAVLNRTRCIVLVPAGGSQGMASCFESLNRWAKPSLVAFTSSRSTANDLLVLVLGEGEAKRLSSGELELGRSSSSGPLVRTKPVITDADLSFGSLIYERSGAVLSGTSVDGKIAPIPQTRASAAEPEERLQRSLTSFFNVITPTGVLIHHTAVLPTTGQIPEEKKEIEAYHLQKGFDVVCFGRQYHVGYHYLVLRNGEVQAGRPERCQGGHAVGYNAYLGISVVGDFSSKDNPSGNKGPTAPSPEQQQAIIELCRRLRERYNLPAHRIMRHSDVAPTDCPGDRFPFVRLLQAIGQ